LTFSERPCFSPTRTPAILALIASLALSACEFGGFKLLDEEPEPQVTVDVPPTPNPPVQLPEPEPVPTLAVTGTQQMLPAGFTPSARVGLLVPLSGRHAPVGQALLNAAQLALFDVADHGLALIVRDTGGTPEGAVRAARSALDESAAVVLGPLFAASVSAVAPEARRFGVNVIGFSNDSTVAGENVFIMGITPDTQVARIIDYAKRQGRRRFAVLAPRTPYGQAVIRAAQAALAGGSAELAKVVTYDPAAQDVTPEIRSLAQYDLRRRALLNQRQQLRARGDEASKLALKRLENQDTLGNPDFDAVLLPAGAPSLMSIAPSLAYYDVDPAEVRFLGTTLWDNPSLGTEPALAGGWFAAPPPKSWTVFAKRYEDTYGETPPRIASLAYDAVALAAVLTRSAVDQRKIFTTESIAQPSGFAGVDGIFRFLPNSRIERGLAVLEMGRDRFKVMEQAPRTFERAVF
jgi:ABC-type branched-subunit amino acid transport system substrate-binding protein